MPPSNLGSRAAAQPPGCGSKLLPPSSLLPIFVSFSVVGGSNDFVIHDFVYLSPPVTSYPLPVTRYSLLATRYSLLATRYSPRRLRRLLLPVDLRPDGEHHIAEEEGIQGDEGDVAAEVEGEHAADEEEQHAAGLVPLQVLPGEDRDPERHQERFARETQAQRI